MTGPYRVDYAVEGHGTWLSMLKGFPTVVLAVREAQNRMESREACIGFRVVHLLHPMFEKMEDDHLGKMVDLQGQKIVPEGATR